MIAETEPELPERAPAWEQLYDRAPYTAEVRDDPTGGVVVHRCHPDAEAQDYFAFASRHESMKGYVDKDVYLFGDSTTLRSGQQSGDVAEFDGPVDAGEEPERPGISKWNRAVASFHFREGSHEDCPVCQGTVDPNDLLQEVVDTATEQVGGDHNVARSGVYGEQDDGSYRAEVYLDSHGMSSMSGPYSVPNSTRHWDDHIVAHPYVQMAGAEDVGDGGNAHSPDDTLKITLKTWYPNTTPGAVC